MRSGCVRTSPKAAHNRLSLLDERLAGDRAYCFAALERVANHIFRIFVAQAQQYFSHLGSVMKAQFDERQANHGRHETEQRQRVFHGDGIALPEQRRRQRRCRPRQALRADRLSLFPRQEHVAAKAGRNVRGDGNAAIAALRHIRQGQRIVPAKKPELRAKK